VHERLVESWLDSASERSYQSPFCQMLAADGHRIVHSTRHSPIELGKDIVSVAPDGVPCAFQLKGNPGGRLSLNQFRDIEPQLRELVNLAISDPSLPPRPHRSYLVTNGLVEEEVRLAIERMNVANATDGYPNRRLEIIQRGDLLHMAKRLGQALWPTEIAQLSMLLEMLVEDGADQFQIERAHHMLREVLGLSEREEPTWSGAELSRRITSAALLTSLSLKNYEARENNYAIVAAWTQFAAYSIAACDRLNLDFSATARSAVTIAGTRIFDALVDLAKEALERKVLLEGDALADAAFYRARYTLVLGLLSILWFWCNARGWPDDLDREALERFLQGGKEQAHHWGEAAIPQILPFYWFLRDTDARKGVEELLVRVLSACVATGPDGKTIGLASPYWDFQAVVRHELAAILGFEQDPMRDEAVGRMSFFAESLLHLLVRTGRKGACFAVWPDVTRTAFAQFRPAKRWQYCLWRTEEGTYVEVQPPLTKQWHQLQDEARSIRSDSAPAALASDPFLHSLFLVLFPYRAVPDVLRSLGYFFDKTWFIPGGRPSGTGAGTA
jgi:hypothetical protein